MTTELIVSIHHTASKGLAIAELTLNRPQTLNALTHEMCTSIANYLEQWQNDENIVAVVFRGAGEKAFCAGGDIRAIYHLGRHDLPVAKQFFTDEYAMNQVLFHFSKPCISIWDGIVMGGGVGVSIHGSHCIATEKTKFAMPECKIGFFPDVGVTYHLSRLPNHYGEYLGLTGVTISADDCLALGLAQGMIRSQEVETFMEHLIACETLTHQTSFTLIDRLIDQFQSHIESEANREVAREVKFKDQIDRIFALNSIESIRAECQKENDEWSERTLAALNANAPQSLAVTLHVIRESRNMNFDALIQRDRQLSHEFLEGESFYEGIRALLIDKDNKPQW